MGYYISYQPEDADRYPPQKVRFPRKKYFLIMVVVLLLVSVFWWEQITDFLTPGDPDVTRQAASTMVSNMRQGLSFGDAVTAFCREIFANGQN